MPTVNEELLDDAIIEQVQIERLKASHFRKLLFILNRDILPKIQNTILRTLSNSNPRQSQRGVKANKSLQRMVDRVSELLKAGGNNLHSTLEADLLEDYLLLGERLERSYTRTIQRALPPEINISLGKPTMQQAIEAVRRQPFRGEVLKDWFTDLSASARRQIVREVNIGIVNGESSQQIARRLRNNANTGVFNKIQRNTESIVRTAVNHTTNAARQGFIDRNPDIITQVKWVSVLDSRTTEICMGLDGRVFSRDEGIRPPAHWGCRSQILPIVGSFNKFGLTDPPPATRASLNGQVPEDTTYIDWLSRQSNSVQNEALGKTKAELFRRGRIKNLSNLVDQKNRPLTIDEIAKKEKIPKKVVTDVRKAVRQGEI